MTIRNCLTDFFKQTCVSIVLLSFAASACGQSPTGYKVHANIIYRFTKYIQWPESEQYGAFVIGIIGDSPLYEELRGLTLNKTVGGQKIVVRQYPDDASSYNCQVLFICDDESSSLKRIVSATRDRPVLLITEHSGLAKKGSCINFVVVDDHLKLEINKNNILNKNLDIASELLQLATLIN